MSSSAVQAATATYSCNQPRTAAGSRPVAIGGRLSAVRLVSMNRCEELRSKGLFIESEWDPTVQQSNERNF